ncbi:Imm1 family immunity protein [Streptoalloteichus hindustanus]|uniref:Immunity protein Imm1 n=1 Tax=Streptoalloteichus hindustanus TaxID=2017 RepID=A0A1M4Z4Q8_STRHI|nr:Imm1 family immunity protein [Streptoalloteichus hindustanus]SHF13031.1 Immunity protein Imm1 [Streptoalloteichus hindustanus]
MVALEAWYDADEGAVLIRTSDDLDSLLDRMVRDADAPVPPMAELFYRGSDGWAIAQAGIRATAGRGFFAYADPDGSVMTCDSGAAGSVEYDYMGNVREVPASAEAPIAEGRRAAHEFLRTGSRPTCVEWQPVK